MEIRLAHYLMKNQTNRANERTRALFIFDRFDYRVAILPIASAGGCPVALTTNTHTHKEPEMMSKYFCLCYSELI